MSSPTHKQNSETTVFVAMPGSEPYATLTKREVREQVAKGAITQSQLIWSAEDNNWKPVRDFSQLQPTGGITAAPAATSSSTSGIQKALPAKSPSTRGGKAEDGATPFPGVRGARPDSSSGMRMASPEKVTAMLKAKMESGRIPNPVAVARPTVTAVPLSSSPIGGPKVVSAGPKVVVVPKTVAKAVVNPATQAAATSFSGKSATVDEAPELGISKMKLFCVGLAALMAVFFAGNIVFVDWPIQKLAKDAGNPTGVSLAHMGGFFQPQHLILRLNSKAFPSDGNALALLIGISSGYYKQPIIGGNLSSVSLYVDGSARFIIAGDIWRELGDKQLNTETALWLAGEMHYADGRPLIGNGKNTAQAWEEVEHRLRGQ
ncbi:MAG: hypothetical protein ACAI35_26010 [Candidatus Methylacidiphilales bacterium]|nr:hypothetical protein [Candidatus Methylacidiphilales bacterium]